ncbi:hypothetical protein SNEBB_006066 [Seison nebaliae]|nr:hypothetical protein SNEBB_006066 [Seison nebaliae]
MEGNDKVKVNNKYLYITIFILGASGTAGWSFYVCSESFFKYKLRTIDNNGTFNESILNDRQKEFQSTFSTITNTLYLITLIALIPFNNYLSINQRVIPWTFIGGVMMIFLLIINTINTDSVQNVYQILILLSAAIFSIQAAIAQSGHFSLVSCLPKIYSAAMMSGQGLIALIASIYSIIIIVLNSNVYYSNLVLSASLVVLYFVTFATFIFMGRTTFIKKMKTENSLNLTERTPMELTATNFQKEKKTLFNISRKIAFTWINCSLAFLISSIVYPGFVTNLEAANYKNDKWHNQLLVLVLVVTNFNLADTLGRFFSHFLLWPTRHQPILLGLYNFLRLILVIICLFCKINSKRKHIPIYIDNEYVCSFLIFILGFTNGHLGSILVYYAPKFVSNSNKEQEAVGVLMCVSIGLGLAIGSGFSLVTTKYI